MPVESELTVIVLPNSRAIDVHLGTTDDTVTLLQFFTIGDVTEKVTAVGNDRVTIIAVVDVTKHVE